MGYMDKSFRKLISGSDRESSGGEEELQEQEDRSSMPIEVLQEEIAKILEETPVKPLLLQQLDAVKKKEESYEERLARLGPIEKRIKKASKKGKPGAREKLETIQAAMDEEKKGLKKANEEVAELKSKLSTLM